MFKMTKKAFVMAPLFTLMLASAALAVDIKGQDGVTVKINNPKRIVTINPTTAEIIYALGEGNRIAGTDIGAKFSAVVEKLPKVGHPYRPSVEGIISLNPDLVIATEENLPTASVQQLRSAKISVLILENSAKDGAEGYKRRVMVIAKALEQEQKGKAEVARFEGRMKQIKAQIKPGAKKQRVFFLYAHGPAKGFIYGRNTGAHYLIEAAGAENAADFTEGTKDLTPEAMTRISPDAIIMLERALKGVGGVAGALKMPGVNLTPAGKNKRILQVDDSVRWIGPRFPDFAENLAKQLNS